MIGFYIPIKYTSCYFVIPYLYRKIIKRYELRNEKEDEIYVSGSYNLQLSEKIIYLGIYPILGSYPIMQISQILFSSFEENNEYNKQIRKIAICYILAKIFFDLTKKRKTPQLMKLDYFSLLPVSLLLDVLIIQNTVAKDLLFITIPFTTDTLCELNKYF